MRKIKFRAKDLTTKEWVCGDLHTLCDQPHIHTEVTAYPFAGKRSFVDQDTIGQFTGYTDMKGKEIYEGDIVIKHRYSEDQQLVCRWMERFACFGFYENVEYGEVYYLNRRDCKETVEVIGNVYDNPDMYHGNEDGTEDYYNKDK
jgi:uncharacterized phage protein (TIGR01671 family)